MSVKVGEESWFYMLFKEVETPWKSWRENNKDLCLYFSKNVWYLLVGLEDREKAVNFLYSEAQNCAPAQLNMGIFLKKMVDVSKTTRR